MKRVVRVAATMLFVACPARAQEVGRLAQPPDLMVYVWYNGGKARAPMLSPITPHSREEWRRDLRQIKSLGFNTVPRRPDSVPDASDDRERGISGLQAERNVDNSNSAMARLNRGDSLKGAQFAESLELLPNRDAKVLARLADGTPGMTVSTHGKGQTMLVGSFLGLANQRSDKNNGRFSLGLLKWAEVSSPFTTSQDGVDSETPLEARLHKNADGYLLYLINHGEAKSSLSVNLNVERDGEFAWNEILSKQTAPKRSDGNVLTFSSQIPAKQVQVWDTRTSQ